MPPKPGLVERVTGMFKAMLSARPQYRLVQGRDGSWCFRLHDYDGQIMLTSTSLPSRAECLAALESARVIAADPKAYRRQTTKDSKFTFIVQRPDGEALGVGSMNSTVSDCDDAIAQVQRVAPKAAVAQDG
jgi:uncharacterized protein YegP (UPF0339 family)